MVSVAEVKKVLGISATDTSRDDEIQRAIDAAVLMAESLTGHYFGLPAETTELIKGKGLPRLWLAQAPTAPIVSINEYSAVGASAVVINAADSNGFVVRGIEVLRKYGTPWTLDYDYEVTYTRGYAGGIIPADAEMWIKAMTVYMWNAVHAGGKKSESFGSYSYSIDPEEAIKLPGGNVTLSRFRRFRI